MTDRLNPLDTGSPVVIPEGQDDAFQGGRGMTIDPGPVEAEPEPPDALTAPVDLQMLDHPGDVLGAARVLDVEEDGASAHGERPVQLGWSDALGRGQRDAVSGQRPGGPRPRRG